MSEPGRLRLLLLSANFGVGGAERHTLDLGQRLRKDRFDVFFAHIKPEAALLSTDQYSACDAFCCGGTRWLDIPAARRLAAFIDEHAIESVLCSNFYPAMVALIARRFSRRRFRVSVVYHSTVLPTLKERLQMRLYVALRSQYELVVFICENQRRHWIESGYPLPLRESTIHNGVDIDAFSPAAVAADASDQCRASAGFSTSDYVIGICAALRPEKAHVDVLKALAKLRRDQTNAKLMIIGDGPQRREIESAITQAGMAEQVFITGYQQDVRPWIASCDVMVLASTAIETFSLAALEAMALEKPLVMSEIGGASEQVSVGRTGYLFKPRDTEQLAKHLRTLSSKQHQTRLGCAARATVVEDFDIQKMVARYERELWRG